jgi:hypothetical protein
MTSIETLMRDSNPMMDPSTEFSEEEIQAIALLTRTRSGNVDVQELTKPVEPEKKRYNGWLIAAAAFAVVMVFIGAAMLLANPADEIPPATTPPTTQAVTPTTQAAPPTTVVAVEEATATTVAPVDDTLSAEDQAFVEDLVAAFNEGDEEAVLEFFAPSASFTTIVQPDSGVEGFRDELVYRWALNAVWEMQDCKIEFSAISCQMLVSKDTYPGGPLPAELRLIVDDGVITSFTLIEDKVTILPTITAFFEWVDDNHPGSLRQMSWGSGNPPLPLLTEESIALWIELLPQYRATLDG